MKHCVPVPCPAQPLNAAVCCCDVKVHPSLSSYESKGPERKLSEVCSHHCIPQSSSGEKVQ